MTEARQVPSSQNPQWEIGPEDPVLEELDFRPYRSAVLRRAVQFLPAPDESQSMTILCPWGEELLAQAGDYIVSEDPDPGDRWPVDREIFERTYEQVREELFRKRQLTHLVPLVCITNDPDALVLVHTLEGDVTVRAGDFHLARGVEGEIWPLPSGKVEAQMSPVDEEDA